MPEEKPTDTAPAAPARPTSKAPPSLLQKDSDRAPRPGFRAPANKHSKAQKKDRKKR